MTERAAVRIPSSPSGWRHWTYFGWCVVVRSYAPYRIEVYDPQGHLVARARTMWRAMSWALRQRSTAEEIARWTSAGVI
jgi:hypothetical protein